MKTVFKYLKYFSAIFLLVFFGFIRDYLFVNLNYQLGSAYYKTFSFKLPYFLSWLGNFNYTQLYYLKYIFTALSVFLFFLATLWAVHVFFHEKKYRQWVWYSYFIIIFACIIIFLSLNWIIGFNDTYTIIRKIIDFGESPLLVMILFPAIIVDKKFNKPRLSGAK